jgi:hypothetical protein
MLLELYKIIREVKYVFNKYDVFNGKDEYVKS